MFGREGTQETVHLLSSALSSWNVKCLKWQNELDTIPAKYRWEWWSFISSIAPFNHRAAVCTCCLFPLDPQVGTWMMSPFGWSYWLESLLKRSCPNLANLFTGPFSPSAVSVTYTSSQKHNRLYWQSPVFWMMWLTKYREGTGANCLVAACSLFVEHGDLRLPSTNAPH